MCWGKPPTEAVAIQRRSVNKQGLPDKPGLVEDMHRAQIWNLCSDRKDVRRNVKQNQGHRLQIKYPIYSSAAKATISVSTKMTEINNKEEIWIISWFLQVRRSAKTKYHKDLTKLEALFFMLHSLFHGLPPPFSSSSVSDFLSSLCNQVLLKTILYAINYIKISKRSLLGKTKQVRSPTIFSKMLTKS